MSFDFNEYGKLIDNQDGTFTFESPDDSGIDPVTLNTTQGSGNLTKDPKAILVTTLTNNAPNNWTPSGVDGNGDTQTWGKHIKLLIIQGGGGDHDIKSIDKSDFEAGDGVDILNDKSDDNKFKYKAKSNGQQQNRIGGKKDLEHERWTVATFVRGLGSADKWCPKIVKVK